MIRFSLIAACIGAPMLMSACASTSTTTADAKAPKERGQLVQVTPEIRARIEAQGFNPDEELCKREDQIGSTIPKRVCASRAAWAAKSDASRAGTEEIQRKGLQTADPLGGI